MLSTYEQLPTVAEADAKRINPDGLFRRMQECGHCPLRDYDIVNLARTYGIGTGTMKQLIKRHALDARLEDENMGKLDETMAMEMYGQGMSDNKMSRALNVSAQTIANWRHKQDLPANGQQIPKSPAAENAPGSDSAEETSKPEKQIDGYQPEDGIHSDPPNVGSSVQDKPTCLLVPQACEEITESIKPGQALAAGLAALKSKLKDLNAGHIENMWAEQEAQLADIEPSYDDLLAEVDRLDEEIIRHERRELFLVGIAVAAGVKAIGRLLRALDEGSLPA